MPKKYVKKEDWSKKRATQARSSWRRRAKTLKSNLDDIPSRKDIQDWLDKQVPYKCYITNCELSHNLIELDHKIPVSRGGSFKLDNIGLTTKRLNNIKGNMTYVEFKKLLKLISRWDDCGASLLNRLYASSTVFRRK